MGAQRAGSVKGVALPLYSSSPGRTNAIARGNAAASPASSASSRRTIAAGTPSAAAESKPLGAELESLRSELDERIRDLQRVSAEYANYRKRVDRDRVVVREQALANVLIALLPVLDDIGRAEEHGELVGGFEKVAQSLESIVTKLGLAAFGNEGEPFDPNVHEAVSLIQSAGVTEPTCIQILQPGYMVGERIVRPARVIVAEPDDAGPDDAGPDAVGADQPDEAGLPSGPDETGPQENREDED